MPKVYKERSNYFASNLSLILLHYSPVLPHPGNPVLPRKPNDNQSCTANLYRSLVNAQYDENKVQT